MTPGRLGIIYDLHEAAERLHMTPRAVAKVARAAGLCTISGRDFLFTDSDLVEIWNKKRSLSSSSPGPALKTTTSVTRSADKAFSSLLARAIEERQKKSASRRKRAS
ncbi:hypothetical protein SAMN02927900_00871 [Rhizobium mongolense subsp. loessense]|uniref:Uncharacterized protein n=1 Tax=Rhizobium mongolense subsp. loessense TaxID=158890 RepID=A0A1G4PRA7_9HYPH|nr:hypothetical protein SAMN02927900_00871 [Rhizobium mongolense subsp. loessense]